MPTRLVLKMVSSSRTEASRDQAEEPAQGHGDAGEQHHHGPREGHRIQGDEAPAVHGQGLGIDVQAEPVQGHGPATQGEGQRLERVGAELAAAADVQKPALAQGPGRAELPLVAAGGEHHPVRGEQQGVEGASLGAEKIVDEGAARLDDEHADGLAAVVTVHRGAEKEPLAAGGEDDRRIHVRGAGQGVGEVGAERVAVAGEARLLRGDRAADNRAGTVEHVHQAHVQGPPGGVQHPLEFRVVHRGAAGADRDDLVQFSQVRGRMAEGADDEGLDFLGQVGGDRPLLLAVEEQGRLVADQGDTGHRDQGQEGDSQQSPDQAAAAGHPALPPVRA
jgi:hypothetical protein